MTFHDPEEASLELRLTETLSQNIDIDYLMPKHIICGLIKPRITVAFSEIDS